jgi:uncharacterized protein
MDEILKLILLAFTGLAAGFINVNAGGGSTLTLPALIFLGLDSTVANGTNRVGIIIQNIFAVSSFRNQSLHRTRQSLTLSLAALPGVIIGSLLSLQINDVWFQRILAAIMVGIVITMLLPGRKVVYENTEVCAKNRKRAMIALFFIGIYGGFIQVGVGFLLMAALYHILKLNLVYVNMHKVFIVLIYMIPSLLIFAYSGNVHWLYGLVLGSGNAAGAWWGAKMQVKGGEKMIKVVLAVAILIMAVKLIL